MLGTQGLYLQHPGNKLYQGVITSEQLEDEMRKIRKENKLLEDRLEELK